MYHQVMIHEGTLVREHERGIEVGRGAAYHYNARIGRESLLKNLSFVEYM